MIGSLMYLIASRPDIQFSTCLCARYQANLKESHLVVVKRIFRYLKGTPNLGLWFPKGSVFDLKAYTDSDYVGCNLDRKSTSEGYQILGRKLVCWSVKKQSSVAMSSAKAEYVPIFCDNTSSIAISDNPVLHSRTKHIDIRYHFITDHILKGDIELHFVLTDLQLADIFTKPLAEPSFTRLVAKLVEKETNTITFLLSWCDEPLSFTQKEFTSATGLPIYENLVPLPPKETERAGLSSLGLFDKDKPTLSSTELVNSSPLKMKYFSPFWKLFMQYIVKCLSGMQGSHDQMNLNQQTIAYCLIYGLEIDIRGIIFSDLIHKLQNGKKHKESNICYTRFLSLFFEKLLGDKYISNDLTLIKPHTITTASFQKPLASDVPLTSRMLKVAKLSEWPEKSLIPPSRE
ncbi:hypothetical protein Tco_0104530 [Tanacetum coccineum]